MKFYQLHIIVALLLYNVQINSFWQKWMDTVTAKFNGITDVIIHKEFAHADELELHNQNGTIVINSWKQNFIAIEVITSCQESFHKDVKIDMECINKIIKIHTHILHEKIKASIIFNILLPEHINITLTTKQGNIIIKDVYSNLHLQTSQGNIIVTNPCKNLIATALSGNIMINTSAIEEFQIFSLVANKGNIHIYTTPMINAIVHATALQGKITSDIPITLESQTTTLDTQAWKNFKQIVKGTIGKPLSTLDMIADNGSISIMPYTKQYDIFN